MLDYISKKMKSLNTAQKENVFKFAGKMYDDVQTEARLTCRPGESLEEAGNRVLMPHLIRQNMQQLEKDIRDKLDMSLKDYERVRSHTPSQAELDKIFAIEKELRLTTMTAFGLVLCDKWRSMIDMVRTSHTLDGRAKHGTVSVLNEEKRTSVLCDKMSHRIDKFYAEIMEQLDNNNEHGVKTDDNYEIWARMVDVSRETFAGPISQCLKALNKAYRKMVSPADPKAFYTVMQLVYLSGVFDNYLTSLYQYIKGEERKPFMHFDPYPVAKELSQMMMLRTKEGKRIAIMYSEDDLRAIHKPFYLRHKREEYITFYPAPAYHTDEIFRVGYSLELALFGFDTIRRIRDAAGIPNEDYEKLFGMKCDALCLTSYEQYHLVTEFHAKNYERALELIEPFRKAIPLWRGKPHKAAVCFTDVPGEGFKLKGIWHSVSEAAREISTDPLLIIKGMKRNDAKKLRDTNQMYSQHYIVWFSLERFEDLLVKIVEARKR